MSVAPGEVDEIAGDALLAGGAALERVLQALSHDGLIAFPTETFYGLGADATSAPAVNRLFEAKGRPEGMPVPVIISDIAALAPLVTDISDSARRLMKAFWPGPLTLVFRAAAEIPGRVTGEARKLGVRVSSHPVAAAIARGCPFPITATSANRSGGAEASTPGALVPAIREAVDLIVNAGRTPGGPPSTVLDVTLEPPVLIRGGRVSQSEIQAVLAAP